MTAIRAWDLSSGKAVAYRGPRPTEIPLAIALPIGSEIDPPPDGVPEDAAQSFQVDLEVWGLGRLVRIEESHFFRRSSWFQAAKADGYDPDNLTNQEGHGYSVSVQAYAMVRDADGGSHVVGALPAGVFLNGGTAPDGTEPLTGAQGIRFRFTVSLSNIEGGDGTIPAWDLVAYLEAIPEARIGCGDVVEAHVGNLSTVKPQPLRFIAASGG